MSFINNGPNANLVGILNSLKRLNDFKFVGNLFNIEQIHANGVILDKVQRIDLKETQIDSKSFPHLGKVFPNVKDLLLHNDHLSNYNSILIALLSMENLQALGNLLCNSFLIKSGLRSMFLLSNLQISQEEKNQLKHAERLI